MGYFTGPVVSLIGINKLMQDAMIAADGELHEGQVCYGLDLRGINADSLRKTGRINLSWMMEFYKAYPYKDKFFDYHQSKQMGDINKLAGTAAFKAQIASGMSEAAIRESWEPGLGRYKEMRKKYVLYR